MMDQNKKQIVIIVVIIIILILSLLGLLVFAVITNKDNNVDITNITTLPIDSTTTQTQSTTIPVPSTTTQSENTTSSVVNNEVDKNKLNIALNTYLNEIKMKGQIGDYKIGNLNIIDLSDDTQKCPNTQYDETNIYAKVIVEYEVKDENFSLTSNVSIKEGKATASATFIFNFVDNTYIVEDLFTGC